MFFHMIFVVLHWATVDFHFFHRSGKILGGVQVICNNAILDALEGAWNGKPNCARSVKRNSSGVKHFLEGVKKNLGGSYPPPNPPENPPMTLSLYPLVWSCMELYGLPEGILLKVGWTLIFHDNFMFLYYGKCLANPWILTKSILSYSINLWILSKSISL